MEEKLQRTKEERDELIEEIETKEAEKKEKKTKRKTKEKSEEAEDHEVHTGNKFRKKPQKKQVESRQAVPTLEEDTRGGIFGGQRDVKEKAKDKTSRAPFQRDNEFKKLRDQVKDIEKETEKIEHMENQITDMADVLMKDSGDGIMQFAGRFAPHMAIALTAIGFMQKIADDLLRDGGFFDRRIKKVIARQFLKLTKRREAEQLKSVERVLRVTTNPGLRGPTGKVFDTFSVQKRGLKLFDTEQEALGKGVLP